MMVEQPVGIEPFVLSLEGYSSAIELRLHGMP